MNMWEWHDYHVTLKSKVMAMMPLPPYSEEEGGHGALTTYSLSFAGGLAYGISSGLHQGISVSKFWKTRNERGSPSPHLPEE